MNEAPGQEAFLQQAAALLDEAERRIPPWDLARLRQSRRNALRGGRWAHPWRWAGGAVALVSVVAFMLFRLAGTEVAPQSMPDMAQLELLAGAQPLEFYEDLAFIQWLEQSEYGR
jgi:hypothetical protein